MKIFLSFLQGKPDYPVPAYSFWQHYIKNGIEEAGDDWEECPDADWAYGLLPLSKSERIKWSDETWAKTVEYLKKNPPDLFLSYLYPNQIDINAINEIKKAGIPCVNFFCDNYREFSRIPTAFGVFDLNWVPEYNSLPDYKRAGFNSIHLPMPMWIDPSYRNLNLNEYPQVTFIGSADQQRIRLFNEVAPKIEALQIYGRGWLNTKTSNPQASSLFNKGMNQIRFINKQGIRSFYEKMTRNKSSVEINEALSAKIQGSLNFEKYLDLSRNSLVTLGVNSFPSFRFPVHKPGKYSRLRDIEAPMLGACYLTEWAEGLDQLYHIDQEIACYSCPEDLTAQLERLKKDKTFRLTLRKKGQQRALSDHSIPNSLKLLKRNL